MCQHGKTKSYLWQYSGSDNNNIPQASVGTPHLLFKALKHCYCRCFIWNSFIASIVSFETHSLFQCIIHLLEYPIPLSACPPVRLSACHAKGVTFFEPSVLLTEERLNSNSRVAFDHQIVIIIIKIVFGWEISDFRGNFGILGKFRILGEISDFRGNFGF